MGAKNFEAGDPWRRICNCTVTALYILYGKVCVCPGGNMLPSEAAARLDVEPGVGKVSTQPVCRGWWERQLEPPALVLVL